MSIRLLIRLVQRSKRILEGKYFFNVNLSLFFYTIRKHFLRKIVEVKKIGEKNFLM